MLSTDLVRENFKYVTARGALHRTVIRIIVYKLNTKTCAVEYIRQHEQTENFFIICACAEKNKIHFLRRRRYKGREL